MALRGKTAFCVPRRGKEKMVPRTREGKGAGRGKKKTASFPRRRGGLIDDGKKKKKKGWFL